MFLRGKALVVTSSTSFHLTSPCCSCFSTLLHLTSPCHSHSHFCSHFHLCSQTSFYPWSQKHQLWSHFQRLLPLALNGIHWIIVNKFTSLHLSCLLVFSPFHLSILSPHSLKSLSKWLTRWSVHILLYLTRTDLLKKTRWATLKASSKKTRKAFTVKIDTMIKLNDMATHTCFLTNKSKLAAYLRYDNIREFRKFRFHYVVLD